MRFPVTAALAVVGVLTASSVPAQNVLTIGSASTGGLNPVDLPISMNNEGDVQGYVLAVAFDTMIVSVTNVEISPDVAAIGAEFVVPEIFEAQGGFTLSVVLDSTPPFDGQVIPVGTDTDIASFTVMPDIVIFPPDPPGSTAFTFTDGTFNNPPLNNVIVIDGFSIGASQGLGLNDGFLDLGVESFNQLYIEDTATPADTPAAVRILLDLSTGPCQGFVLAVGHDSSVVSLTGIDLDGTVTASVGAEFVVPNVEMDGGTIGVVLDFDPPFDGQVIPPGTGLHIANYDYICINAPPCTEPPCPPTVASLSFQDGTFGNPTLDNVIVVAGLSLNPGQNDGALTCISVIPPTVDTEFFCGVEDPDGNIVDPEGSPGDIVNLGFFYTECDGLSVPGVPANIQGFQLALSYDCNLCMVDGSFSVEGSILDAVGAEFVSASVDNDPDDGDGCELVVGILLDALPPFDGQTAPPTCTPLLIGTIDIEIKESADCDTCLAVSFTDGVNGSENVPIQNIVVMGNQSIQNFDTFDCNICVVPQQQFIRGDCNGDTKVDLADASSVLAQQFQGLPVPCLDGCDANDDGKINLADTVFILNYLFDSGPPPPDPGPDLDPGADPSEDDLDCEDGVDSCG